MKELDIGCLSTVYEKLYKNISAKTTKEVAFCSVNNALIFSYFVRFINPKIDIANYREYEKILSEKFNKSLFFDTLHIEESYTQYYQLAIETILPIFSKVEVADDSLEKLLGNVLEKHINQKETGSYYTPKDTTTYMAWNAIFITALNKCGVNIKEKVSHHFNIIEPIDLLNYGLSIKDIIVIVLELLTEKEKKQFADKLFSLKIIDPTCGSGAFIITAFECLYYISSLLGVVNYEKILNTLYGLDIEPEAIKLTKLRLIIKTAGEKNSAKYFNEKFDRHFFVADALKGADYIIEETGFDWKSYGTKFDCIIGNPPYVESKNYVSDNFQTQKCVNLYAHTLERACNIASANAIISLIVPLSLVSTTRMQPAKNYIEKHCSNVYYATFADRPGCIFSGVHQRLTIFFAQNKKNNKQSCKVFSSKYHFWYNNERPTLFDNITYFENSSNGLLAKIGNATEKEILQKLTTGTDSFVSLFTKNSEEHCLYVSTRIGFWAKAFYKNVFSSKEYKIYYTDTEWEKVVATAIFNSSIFYFLWVVLSDCWHITNNNIETLTLDKSKLILINKEYLINLVEKLMLDLEKNKKYIGSKQTEYEYKHKFSKQIIDEIDDCLAPIFSLTQSEVEYIKKYTERYRLNTAEDK